MQLLVTGATGVLGRRAVPALVAAGHDVRAVSRRDGADEVLRGAGATPVRLDLFDGAAVRRAADDCDGVLHLATHIPAAPAALRRAAWRENDRLRRDASAVLADAAAATGARFVQESFAATYADGGAAWLDEDAPLAAGWQTASVLDAEANARRVTLAGGVGVVLRFGLFLDPDADQTRELVTGARRGRLFQPGPPDAYASYVHVADAAAAVVTALQLPAGAWNVVDDVPVTAHEHATIVSEVLGQQVRPIPAALGRLPALRVLARSTRVSNARLRAASTWRPVAAPSVRVAWEQLAGSVPA